MVIVLIYYCFYLVVVFVAPTALMMAETPERRDVAFSDVFVISLQDFLWILTADYD